MAAALEKIPDGTNQANRIAFIVFSSLAVTSNIVPAIILIRVKSLAASTAIITNMVLLFFFFINAIIWPNDDEKNWWNGHGLCDIEVTIRTPSYTLLASAICRLVMDLAKAVDVENPRLFENRAQRRRRNFYAVLFIFGIPVIQMCLHYLVQAARYDVLAVYGCGDYLDLSWARIVVMAMWPVIFGLLNCWYSILTLHRVRKHRGRLSKTLSRTGSGLDARKFLKLFSMVMLILLLYLPILGYFLYTNWPTPFHAYSYSRYHNVHWGTIIYVPIALVPQIQYWAWSPVTLAALFFVWYGLTTEAVDCYRVGLLRLGLGRIWPVLKDPYTPHRSRGGTRPSTVSWLNKLDLVGKAVDFMDGTKKGTRNAKSGVSGTTHSDSSSRKGSFNKNATSSTTNSDPDAITPVPTQSYTARKTPDNNVEELECSSPATTSPPPPRTMFSAFRTHLHLPFPLFTSSSTKSTSAPTTLSHPADIEKQASAIEEPPRTYTTDNTVETNIWSGTSVHEDEKDDPTSPKMGTRAYRDRERLEKEMRESRERDDRSRIVADNVCVELGLPMQGSTSRSGVAVKQNVVRKEEASSSRS